MSDRRQAFRNRVYYSGLIVFNDRMSTVACVVRNFTHFGAMVEFENPAIVPDWVDFKVPRKGLSSLVRLAWCGRDRAGLVFSVSPVSGDAAPTEWQRKLRDSEQVNKALQSQLDQLRSEY